MPDGYVVETHAGRLIEARVTRLRTREEADAYSRDLAEVVTRFPSAVSPVLCADHRPVRIYPQPAADRLAELFARMNDRLERVAILVAPTNATLGLQLDRIVREVENPRRRVFRHTEEALRHLALSLDADELERARAFLASWAPV